MTHLLWNILALLMIIVFLLGFICTFIGQIGKDVMNLVTYLVSEDNLGEGKENLLVDQLGDAKDYISTCIDGNGDIINKLGIDKSQLESFDGLKEAEEQIEKAKVDFENNKQMVTYNMTMKYFIDIQKDLKADEDFGYILQKCENGNPPSYLKFQEILEKVNTDTLTKSKNEKWDSTCVETIGCPEGTQCYNPLSCIPSERSWISSGSNSLRLNADIIRDIKNSINYGNTKEPENGGYRKTLEELKNSYDGFLNGYIGVLGTVNESIKQITNIIKEYTGDDGGLFSFVNCNFIGNNLKVILKYLKSS